MSVFDLLDCIFIVIWTNEGMGYSISIPCEIEGVKTADLRDRYIAAIDDPEACIEGIDLERNVVAAIKCQATGTCTNAG
jgi:hypothetical protein